MALVKLCEFDNAMFKGYVETTSLGFTNYYAKTLSLNDKISIIASIKIPILSNISDVSTSALTVKLKPKGSILRIRVNIQNGVYFYSASTNDIPLVRHNVNIDTFGSNDSLNNGTDYNIPGFNTATITGGINAIASNSYNELMEVMVSPNELMLWNWVMGAVSTGMVQGGVCLTFTIEEALKTEYAKK